MKNLNSLDVQGACLVYDCNGNYLAQLVLCFINHGDYASIVGIDWYNGLEGHTNSNAPTLAVALESGKLQVSPFGTNNNSSLITLVSKLHLIQIACIGLYNSYSRLNT